MSAVATRVVLDQEPFRSHQFAHGLWRRFHWPAAWIAPEGSLEPPIVFAARRVFTVEAGHEPIRIHVSADERFELYLDGERIARGPERGDTNHYCFQTYDLTNLSPGSHLLTARVWALGEAGPAAQLSAGPAFLLAAEGSWGERLSTGVAPWECRKIDGISLRDHPDIGAHDFTGRKLRIEAATYPFDYARDAAPSDAWTPARKRYAATTSVPTDRSSLRTLVPARLPDMLSRAAPPGKVRFAERLAAGVGLNRHPCLSANSDGQLAQAGQRLLDGATPLTVEPHSCVRFIIDLQEYFCAYPHLVVSGGAGARIELGWAESLYLDPQKHLKDHRDEVEGKVFVGFADEFLPDGGTERLFDTLWWQAGRYVQLHIITGATTLTLSRINLEETRYPLSLSRLPRSDDPALQVAIRLSKRALECCLHETFMDCPYYEQLQYVGDTRLEALALLTCGDDDRPVRKAIELFDSSRLPSGWTQSRYPCRIMQVITTFSMIWVGMVHDFARLRDDADFVRARMPGVRAVIDACLAHVDSKTNLLRNPPGWNFMDWSPQFPDGVPPGSTEGPCGSINWLFVLLLRWWMELEQRFGEPEIAARARRWLMAVSQSVDAAFWDESRGAWAEDLLLQHFSEHAQALGILTGTASTDRCKRAGRWLVNPRPDFAPATIYFTHYVLEALRLLGENSAIDRRLDLWRGLSKTGLKTLPEQPEPTRSDCHAWGAHLLYHLATTES